MDKTAFLKQALSLLAALTVGVVLTLGYFGADAYIRVRAEQEATNVINTYHRKVIVPMASPASVSTQKESRNE